MSCNTNVIDADDINFDILVGPHESSSRIDKNSEFEVCAITFNCGITTPVIYGDVTLVDLNVTGQFCARIGQPGECEERVNENFCPDGLLGLTHYSSQVEEDIGLDLEGSTQLADAFQLFDNWMKVYLMTTPPAPCFRERASCENDLQSPEYFYIEWNNIPRRCLGFLDVQVPLITELKIDYVKSSLNIDCDFTDPSVVTVNTGSTTVERFQAFTDRPDGVFSGMVGATIWREYVVEPGISYDVRIYGINYNCEHSLKYMVEKSLCTLVIDVPSEPLNLICDSETIQTIHLDWNKPIDHNIGFPGNSTTPNLEQYAIDYVALNTIRFGGLVPPLGITNFLTGNTNTEATISSLNPGTTYEFEVSGKNVLNNFGGDGLDGYGGESNVIYCTTLVPNGPNELGSLDLHNKGTLTYSGGACTLDAVTFYENVYNWNTLDPTNSDSDRQIRTDDTTINLKNNFKVGTETLITSTIFGHSGLSGTYTTNVASINLDGFGNNLSVPDTNLDINSITQLVITEDSEFYANPTDFQGFWKDWSGYTVGYDLGITSEDRSSVFYANFEREYKIRLSQDHLDVDENPTYVSNVPTEIIFVIDDLNIVPGIIACGLTDVDVSGVMLVSGVPTFTTDTTFHFQFTETEIAHKFIRPDKCHATYGLYLSDNTLVSELNTISQSDIGGSHKYYTSPGVITSQQYYETSTTLHNTNGLILEENPGNIQFNDFITGFSSLATEVCDDDVKLTIEGCNLFGIGETIDSGFLDITNGLTKKIRIDTCSTECLYNTLGIAVSSFNDLGLLVQSYLDTNTDLNPQTLIKYPILINNVNSKTGDEYDQSGDLVSNGDYVQTLQLYQGRWRNPVALVGDYYMPAGAIVPDYSGAIEDGDYRYVTFKYQRTAAQFDKVSADPAITRERVRLTIIDPSGLTVDFNGFDLANHKMQLKVQGSGATAPTVAGVSTDDDAYDTYWLDCTNVTQSIGIINGVVSQNNPELSPYHNGDHVGCINGGTSTVQQRDCFIPVVTNHTAIFFVRIGWANNVDFSIGCGVYLEVITGTFADNPVNPFL